MTNEEARERVTRIKIYGGMTIPASMNDIKALDMAIQALKDEDRAGEWISNLDTFGFPLYTCTNCRFDGNLMWKFCPNCGAKMKGEEEE